MSVISVYFRPELHTLNLQSSVISFASAAKATLRLSASSVSSAISHFFIINAIPFYDTPT